MKKAQVFFTLICCYTLIVYTAYANSVSFSESYTQGNAEASGYASSSSASESTTANSEAVSLGQGTGSSVNVADSGQSSTDSHSSSFTQGQGASFGSAAANNIGNNLFTSSTSDALSAKEGEASSQASAKSGSQYIGGLNNQLSQENTNVQSNQVGTGYSQSESVTSNTGVFGFSSTTNNAYAQQYAAAYNYPYSGITGIDSLVEASIPGYALTENYGYSNTGGICGEYNTVDNNLQGCSTVEGNAQVGSINSAYNGGISSSQAQSYYFG